MATVTAPRGAWGRVLAHAPWSAWARARLAFVSAGIPVGALAGLLVALCLSGKAFPLSVLLLLALPPLCAVLTAVQRSRFRALLGLEIPEVPPSQRPYGVRRLGAWLRSDSTWRRLGYHLLAAPVLAAAGIGALLLLGAGLFMAADVTGIGVLLVLAAPYLAALVAAADVRLAAALLGPSTAAQLKHRVEELAESRAGVVDAADAERRRIERDLHDGAQQRLVSLAMNLGLARKTLRDVPPEAMRVIADAHEEAQAAIAELRHLVRGLHPAVLEDRGLDAALSGIAARAPLPVRLSVHLPRRPAPTVEAVAYFVVSEALANVAKHARASRAEVDVRGEGDRLRVVVTDDGAGGADPAAGTGLAGLHKRVASVDGAFRLSSPVGGPTIVTVELPCAL